MTEYEENICRQYLQEPVRLVNDGRGVAVPVVYHLMRRLPAQHAPLGQRDLERDARAEEPADRVHRPLALLVYLHVHVPRCASKRDQRQHMTAMSEGTRTEETGIEQPVVQPLIHPARDAAVVGALGTVPVSRHGI